MYLHRLQVESVRGFSGSRAIDLVFNREVGGEDVCDDYRGWTVIAGRNGSGKTTLLRTIALALAGPEVANTLTEGEADWISHGATEAVVHAEIRRDSGELNLGTGRPAEAFAARLRWSQEEGGRPRPQANWKRGLLGGRMAERSLWSAKPSGWFSAGYGPFRRLAGTSGEVARLMAGDYTASRFVTLFREEASLAETVQWLQQVNYRARSDRPGYAILEEKVLALLNDGLFPDGHHVDHVDPDGVWIRRQDRSPIRVDEMSDGYRTVTALVTDIVRQLHQCFEGNVEWASDRPAVNSGGIILIDEVDVHLHVSWQKKIGPWLVDHFPYMQFIVTTHSPYVCQTADSGGLIRLPGPDDDFAPHVVSEGLFRRVVFGSGDDAALTELFGLDSPYSDRAEDLRQELTVLERKVIMRQADEADTLKYRRLVNDLEPSPTSRAIDVQREVNT